MAAIHLTFDDGPHETFTPAVLDVLARHAAKATFFQEGRYVEHRPGLTRRTAEEGHTVGNHAWNHPDLADTDVERIRDELTSTSDAIERACGRRPAHFRPPYGSPFVDTPDHPKGGEIRDVAAALGMATVIWDVSPEDWKKPGADAIAKRVLDAPEVVAAQPGVVVLLHDGECADEIDNLAALEVILAALTSRGFTFAALS